MSENNVEHSGTKGIDFRTIDRVTAEACYVRKEPPWEGMWVFRNKSPFKLSDHDVMGLNEESMLLCLENMRKNGSPHLALYEQAYAKMKQLQQQDG